MPSTQHLIRRASLDDAAAIKDDRAKFFAGVYALYCGVVFIATAGLLIAPIGAHILHRFHLDREEK